MAPYSISFSTVSGVRANLRMVIVEPRRRDRLDDGVHARAVLEARVDERRRLVDPPPQRRHDSLDDRAPRARRR